MTAPTLTTPRLHIRPFQRKDLRAFADYRAIDSVARYQSWSNYTYHDALKLFESMDYQSFGAVGEWYQLAIVEPATDQLLGDLALHFIDEEQMEVGFTLAPQYQGKGLAKAALQTLLDYVFGDLGRHRVIAITDARNTAAYRLLESLLFRREAHYVQNVFFKGAWGDEYAYALLRAEYLQGANRSEA